MDHFLICSVHSKKKESFNHIIQQINTTSNTPIIQSIEYTKLWIIETQSPITPQQQKQMEEEWIISSKKHSGLFVHPLLHHHHLARADQSKLIQHG